MRPPSLQFNGRLKQLTTGDGGLLDQIRSENEFIDNLLDRNQICLVALDRDKFAGFVLINTEHADMPLVNYAAGLPHGCAYIEHISVNKEYRHIGLGRELMYAAINCVYWRGYHQMMCGVLPSNKPSIKMIKSVGFEPLFDIHYSKILSKEVWA